ncbi:MAG: hypothetical protein EXR11_09790 [Rhodospirillaceae bacterium]|nr:hypothetical protein [Rhodospirillaceae bacterium]
MASVNALAGQDLTQPWPYRLPSVLGVWLAVLATAWAAARVASPAAGLAAGTILATSVLVIVEAHLAKADGLLLGCSAIVMAGLLQAYQQGGHQKLPLVVWAAVWVALGVSILIKGPILIGIVVLALASLGIADKSLSLTRRLNPVLGIPIMLCVMAIWPLAAGPDEIIRFAQAALTQDLLPKIAGGVESHGAPPGTHLLAAVGTLWPWSWAAPIAAVMAWRHRQNSAVRLCIAWILPFWFLLELTPTKLPHYPLPLFPAIAVLIALSLAKDRAWGAVRFVSVGLSWARAVRQPRGSRYLWHGRQTSELGGPEYQPEFSCVPQAAPKSFARDPRRVS